MTTNDPEASSPIVRIINSGWSTAGAVLAVPLAGAAVFTGSGGWAAGAVLVACAGGAVAAYTTRPEPPPGPIDEPRPKPDSSDQRIRTYNFLSETRISLLHAQMNRGTESDRLIEELRKAQGRVQGGISVPRVSFIGERVRETASTYQRRLTHTLPTMADDVLNRLKAMGLIHRTDDEDLERVADLVVQPDVADQFLKFYMAGPDFRLAATPSGWLARLLQLAQEREVEVTSHGLTITMHIGTRGTQEDFDALEDKENAAVVGVIRRLDTRSRTATVRVIAVY
ncbi:hypothetical protein [Nocardioides albus]|uniref:Uncharacterized protein n=1 Tax=Nocardioides albus TaxID=1841 RepID=A0A7W5A4X7_9ACTN|nr:hypothetical protein [Nocardioides albus]MBB3089495.1 hypothetical protein [Nocardioides albus]GGU31354.1 hypothetical protein GCM10007979_32950 [Nocardioides albus]